MTWGNVLRLTLLSWLVFAVLLLANNTPAHAAINSQINFQGKLTNPDGTNVTNGNYSITFSIYSASTGGTALWTETQSSVTITDGIFQVSLGSVNTALATSVDFNSSPLYLGIKVGSDAEMTPRVLFTAAPYAFNSDKLGGISSAGYVQLSPGSQQTGFINIGGNITAGGSYNGNTFTNNSLIFGGSSTASIQSAASQNLQLDSGSSGNVSLGATNATGVTIGKFGTAVNAPGGITVNSGTNVPTVDQVVIDNTSSTGVTTAGVNGLNVKYKGGNGAVESGGIRIDFTPGTTSGSTWNGMRVVANTTGPVSGVNANGIKLDGPTAQGAGTETAVAVASGWDIGIDIQSGGMQLAAQSDPSAPAANNLRIYSRDIAGRIMPKWVAPTGADTAFQASLGFNRVAMAVANGTANCSTGYTAFGTTMTGAGTCTVPTLSATNLLTSVRRQSYSTGTVAATVAYQRQNNLMAWRGNAAGVGGFFFTTRFGLSALQSGNRAFVGLSDSVANPTNVDPTTNTTPGKIGMAINANTGNWKLVYNITGSAPTVVDLGANFTVNTTDLYELVLFSAPNSSSIGYRVKNLSSNQQSSGSLNTNIPSSTTFLSPNVWITNNLTAGASILDYVGWYLESDN